MSQDAAIKALRTARAALVAQPSHGCTCYGEPQHRLTCHVGKRDRAVEVVERALSQQRMELR